MTPQTRLKIPQVSPKIHPRRVKLQNSKNSVNIKKNNNSLFMFLSFTPTPSRDARPRIWACVREGVGERVNLRNRGRRAQPSAPPTLATSTHPLAHVASLAARRSTIPTPQSARRGPNRRVCQCGRHAPPGHRFFRAMSRGDGRGNGNR